MQAGLSASQVYSCLSPCTKQASKQASKIGLQVYRLFRSSRFTKQPSKQVSRPPTEVERVPSASLLYRGWTTHALIRVSAPRLGPQVSYHSRGVEPKIVTELVM